MAAATQVGGYNWFPRSLGREGPLVPVAMDMSPSTTAQVSKIEDVSGRAFATPPSSLNVEQSSSPCIEKGFSPGVGSSFPSPILGRRSSSFSLQGGASKSALATIARRLSTQELATPPSGVRIAPVAATDAADATRASFAMANRQFAEYTKNPAWDTTRKWFPDFVYGAFPIIETNLSIYVLNTLFFGPLATLGERPSDSSPKEAIAAYYAKRAAIHDAIVSHIPANPVSIDSSKKEGLKKLVMNFIAHFYPVGSCSPLIRHIMKVRQLHTAEEGKVAFLDAVNCPISALVYEITHQLELRKFERENIAFMDMYKRNREWNSSDTYFSDDVYLVADSAVDPCVARFGPANPTDHARCVSETNFTIKALNTYLLEPIQNSGLIPAEDQICLIYQNIVMLFRNFSGGSGLDGRRESIKRAENILSVFYQREKNALEKAIRACVSSGARVKSLAPVVSVLVRAGQVTSPKEAYEKLFTQPIVWVAVAIGSEAFRQMRDGSRL